MCAVHLVRDPDSEISSCPGVDFALINVPTYLVRVLRPLAQWMQRVSKQLLSLAKGASGPAKSLFQPKEDRGDLLPSPSQNPQPREMWNHPVTVHLRPCDILCDVDFDPSEIRSAAMGIFGANRRDHRLSVEIEPGRSPAFPRVYHDRAHAAQSHQCGSLREWRGFYRRYRLVTGQWSDLPRGFPGRFSGKIPGPENHKNPLFYWCRVRELNSRPTVYKTAALPLS
jgi:hypothetical protein